MFDRSDECPWPIASGGAQHRCGGWPPSSVREPRAGDRIAPPSPRDEPSAVVDTEPPEPAAPGYEPAPPSTADHQSDLMWRTLPAALGGRRVGGRPGASARWRTTETARTRPSRDAVCGCRAARHAIRIVIHRRLRDVSGVVLPARSGRSGRSRRARGRSGLSYGASDPAFGDASLRYGDGTDKGDDLTQID